MEIQYLQDMEDVDETVHGAWLGTLKTQKYASFGFEQKKWEEEPLFYRFRKKGAEEQWICQSNFVGIIWYQNRLILSLPKAVQVNPKAGKEEKQKTFLGYVQLLDLYFAEVKKQAPAGFIPQSPWCIEGMKPWCETILQTDQTFPVPQVIAAVKFEKVFEWMLGILFQNQVRITRDSVMLQSQILQKAGKEWVNINSQEYNTYEWNAIGKRNDESHKLEKREEFFEDQEKKNIPDIVTEILPEEEGQQKCCCVIDAKYSGWSREKNRYKLPGNMDIYKQFFYQEQMLRIYEQAGERNVDVFNFLILPDHPGDIKAGILRQCATIEFPYHPGRSIAVLQINMDELIHACVKQDPEDLKKKREVLPHMVKNYKKVVPMVSET